MSAPDQLSAGNGDVNDTVQTCRVCGNLLNPAEKLICAECDRSGFGPTRQRPSNLDPWDFCKREKKWGIYPASAINDGIDFFVAEADSKELAQRIVDAVNGALPQAAATTRPAAFLAWAVDMFGAVALNRTERLMRFVEEAIELAHAEGMASGTLEQIVNRVYARPPGDSLREIGQAQACLETFAENIGLSSEQLAADEFERVQQIPREEWQRRHKAKQDIGIAMRSEGTT